MPKSLRFLFIFLFLLVMLLCACPGPEKKAQIDTLYSDHEFTAEQVDGIVQDIRLQFPTAFDKTVDFFGDKEVAKDLSGIRINLESTPDNLWFRCGWYSEPQEGDALPTVEIFASQFITGQCKMETALSQLLIGAVLYAKQSKANWQTESVLYGVMNFGSDRWKEMTRREFSVSLPPYSLEFAMKDAVRASYIKQALYGKCLDEIGGSDKLRELLALLRKGEPSEKALENIYGNGEELAKMVDACIAKYLEPQLSIGEEYRAVFRDVFAKEYEKAAPRLEKYIADHPGMIFENHAHFFYGVTLSRLGRHEEAIREFEAVRKGAYGPNYLSEQAATAYVMELLRQKKCEQAKKTNIEFSRMYTKSHYTLKKIDQWNKQWERFCNTESSEPASAKKQEKPTT